MKKGAIINFKLFLILAFLIFLIGFLEKASFFVYERFFKKPIPISSSETEKEVKSFLDYKAEFLNQSTSPSLYPGEKAMLSVAFKNIGNTLWEKTGKNPLHLGVNKPKTRKSPLKAKTWLSEDRPAHLDQEKVKPGEEGTLKFEIEAPKNLNNPVPLYFKEDFILVAEEKTFFGKDGEVSFIINIKPKNLFFGFLTYQDPFAPFSYSFILFSLFLFWLLFFAQKEGFSLSLLGKTFLSFSLIFFLICPFIYIYLPDLLEKTGQRGFIFLAFGIFLLFLNYFEKKVILKKK